MPGQHLTPRCEMLSTTHSFRSTTSNSSHAQLYFLRLPPQHFPQQLFQHLIHIHPCHKFHRGLCAPKQCSAHVGSAEFTRLLVVCRYQFIYCLNVVADIIYLFMSLISIYSGIMKICSCQRPTIWELWKSVHVNDSQFGKEEGVPNDGSQINRSRKMVEPRRNWLTTTMPTPQPYWQLTPQT